MTFWIVVATYPSGKQMEFDVWPDNRRRAREMAALLREDRGAIAAYVVKRHEWESEPAPSSMTGGVQSEKEPK